MTVKSGKENISKYRFVEISKQGNDARCGRERGGEMKEEERVEESHNGTDNFN